MADINNIKKRIAEMSKIALNMWRLTYQAFMEHNLELFSKIFEEENKLNAMEKELTNGLIELGRVVPGEEKLKITVYTDIVGDLELIGDYCKDTLERVQIKIEEKLLFSDDAVKEYSELYRKTEDALDEVVRALDKDRPDMIKDVLEKEEHIDSLIDAYRNRHNQRLIDGVCAPFACNMFLNMLDFTAAVYYHTKKIARNLLKIK